MVMLKLLPRFSRHTDELNYSDKGPGQHIPSLKREGSFSISFSSSNSKVCCVFCFVDWCPKTPQDLRHKIRMHATLQVCNMTGCIWSSIHHFNYFPSCWQYQAMLCRKTAASPALWQLILSEWVELDGVAQTEEEKGEKPVKFKFKSKSELHKSPLCFYMVCYVNIRLGNNTTKT